MKQTLKSIAAFAIGWLTMSGLILLTSVMFDFKLDWVVLPVSIIAGIISVFMFFYFDEQ